MRHDAGSDRAVVLWCVNAWGILPDVRRIVEILRSDRQTMLFSAALDGDVGQLRIGSPRTRSDTRSVRAA